MQVYDSPRGPVVHADFYRLRGARELDNLGWEEAIEDAIAIVEWPERVPEALPADRLEVAIRFDPARGPDFRALEMRGRGADGAAAGARARRRRASAAAPAGREARREFMQGDASVRALRAADQADGTTAILMVSPPRPEGPIIRFGKPYAAIAKLSPDIRAFLAMAEGLREPRLFDAEDLAAQRRGRAGADRGFRRRDRRRGRRPQPRALRRGGRAARRSARARTARRACRSATRSIACRPTTSRRC